MTELLPPKVYQFTLRVTPRDRYFSAKLDDVQFSGHSKCETCRHRKYGFPISFSHYFFFFFFLYIMDEELLKR